MKWLVLAVLAVLTWDASARILDVRAFGAAYSATAGDKASLLNNSRAISAAFRAARPGDTVLIPKDSTGALWTTGGIVAANLTNVELHIEGAVRAAGGWEPWRLERPGEYAPFIHILNSRFLTLTGGGTLDGSGKVWWNRYLIKPMKAKRPKLIVIENVTDLAVHHLKLTNSPSFHLQLTDCARVEVHHVDVVVDRKIPVWDPKLQPEDLNTDGFDLSGKDIWVHDCRIVNDDDSIAVKPCGPGKCVNAKCTENLLIEDMQLTGFGASIGSVPPKVPPAGEKFGHCVRNVTFRRIRMPETGKGIYIKSNPSCDDSSATALIADVLYEDIVIDKPSWWAIWIGPQQQHEPGSALDEKCALTYPFKKHCPTQGCVTFRNITLRRVNVTDPLLSPGVLLGNASNPMDISFQSVVYKYTGSIGGLVPFGRHFHCEHTKLLTDAATFPAPKCSSEFLFPDKQVQPIVV